MRKQIFIIVSLPITRGDATRPSYYTNVPTTTEDNFLSIICLNYSVTVVQSMRLSSWEASGETDDGKLLAMIRLEIHILF